MNAGEIVDRFGSDGFVLVERVLDQRQIQAAQNGVQWAMAQPKERYQWIRQRTYEWFHEHPIFVELIEHPLVIDFAANWLGQDFHLMGAQCSRNTRDDPYAPGAMKLHQDANLFPKPEHRAPGVLDDRYGFSAMWYVQDTPLEMGPTEIVRGSHADGNDYQSAEIDESRLFRQAIPAGSLLIFNHRVWHRGALNQTDRPRDLITNAYVRPEIEKSHLLTTQADGSAHYIPCTELMEKSPILHQLLKELRSTP